MAKVYVKKTTYPCRYCDGWGVLEIPDGKNKKVTRQKCTVCEGTGQFQMTEVFQDKDKPVYE